MRSRVEIYAVAASHLTILLLRMRVKHAQVRARTLVYTLYTRAQKEIQEAAVDVSLDIVYGLIIS